MQHEYETDQVPDKNANSTADGEQRQRDYRSVADALLAGVLSSAVNPGGHVSPLKVKHYRDVLLADAGVTDDPLQRLLAEAAVAAHARVLDIHAKAAVADDPDTIAALTVAATRLTAELRRSVDTLTRCRAVAKPRESTVTYRVVRDEGDEKAVAAA